jgi:hypothetical protein
MLNSHLTISEYTFNVVAMNSFGANNSEDGLWIWRCMPSLAGGAGHTSAVSEYAGPLGPQEEIHLARRARMNEEFRVTRT